MKLSDNNFKWFGNDEDGLSLIDTISFSMFIFYIIFKIIHIIIIIKYSVNPTILEYLNKADESITSTTELILMAFVFEKGVDKTITKISQVKNGASVQEVLNTFMNNVETKNNNNNINTNKEDLN